MSQFLTSDSIKTFEIQLEAELNASCSRNRINPAKLERESWIKSASRPLTAVLYSSPNTERVCGHQTSFQGSDLWVIYTKTKKKNVKISI